MKYRLNSLAFGSNIEINYLQGDPGTGEYTQARRFENIGDFRDYFNFLGKVLASCNILEEAREGSQTP